MANIFKDIIKRIGKNYKYAKLLNGYSPIFRQFGKDVYKSDIVQMCIDVIATESSKVQLRHIRNKDDGSQVECKSELNYLLRFEPNPLMTPKDFIERSIWQLYENYNCFIYPTYKYDAQRNAVFTGLYPLNPSVVTFLQDPVGKLYVQLEFLNSDCKTTLPYSEVIHIRKKFSKNDIMGGGVDGQPNNAAVLKVLEINETALQGIDKGVKTSMQIRGIINMGTMSNEDALKAEREKFETALKNNDSGILALDLKSDYTSLKVDPKLVDQTTLDFLESKVLKYYGVSLPILTGDYSDEQYQAFYEKTIEPLIMSFAQAFSKVLFTKNQLIRGNYIGTYIKDNMFLSTKSKLEILRIAGDQGLLSDNQKLALLGYPPVAGGERVTQSLNYADKSIVTQYQLKQSLNKSKENTDDKEV